MSIDHLVTDRSLISFPRYLNSDQVEQLLVYLREHGKGDIRYDITYRKILSAQIEKATGSRAPEIVHAEIVGAISRHFNGSFASEQFRCNFNLYDNTSLEPTAVSLEFERIPDFKFGDYRPEVIQLWDKTKELVGKYFRENF